MTKRHLFEVNLSEYENECRRVNRNLIAARSMMEEAMDAARRVAFASLAAGISEAEVARLVGVSTPTLRRWQGKK